MNDPLDQERLRHAIAGALARCTEAFIMFPVDTVKTRLQFQGRTQVDKKIKTYTGIWNTLYSIARDEGIKGFTRGLLPRFLYLIPAAAISFLCYEEIARSFHSLIESKSDPHSDYSAHVKTMLLSLLGITTARVVGSLCRTPFDVLKLRLQVQGSLSHMKYRNSWQALHSMLRTEGLAGFFSYTHAALLRDIPFSVIYFSFYEFAKTIQTNLMKKYDKKMGTVNHLISGGLAGMVATSATIPLDVIKTRLQTQAVLPPEERIYKGVRHAFLEIARKEGIKGLTRGLGARIVYLTPASAIVFASYEQYKKILTNMSNTKTAN